MNRILKLVGPLEKEDSGERTSVAKALGQLRTYFAAYPSVGEPVTRTNYTGGQFEALGLRQTGRENVVDALDLVALSTLSVTVDGHAAIHILGPLQAQISELLVAIRTDIDLVNAGDDVIGAGSAADTLYWLLRGIDGLGRTKVSKLLAQKRPRLIPIYDDVVGKALGVRQGEFWAPLRATMNDTGYGPKGENLHGYLGRLRDMAGLPEHVSRLRVFDVIEWMTEADKPFVPVTADEVEQLMSDAI